MSATRRGLRALQLAGVVFIAAAVVTIGVVVKQADRSEAAVAAPVDTGASRPGATALWSPRRIPQVIAAAATRQHFPRLLAGFAAAGRCIAVDGPDGPLVRDAATTPLTPASTQKLLTAAAALSVLGPDHVFTTNAKTTARPSGGVLPGNLYLVGGGDPVLATPAYQQRLAANPETATAVTTPLAKLADAIVAAGVHRVNGAIVADDSRYDTVRYPPTLKASERGVDLGPLGALSVDAGFGPNGVAAADPAVLAATGLAALLTARGVVVASAPERGTTPANARTIAAVTSPRLDAIVSSMLTVSDNYTAEMLVRAVGLAGAGTGSTPAGLRVVTATLVHLGVPTGGVSLVDGSGLSPEDRVTCAALLAAVELGDRPTERALRVGLPIAGRTGTLVQRFVGGPLAGRLRAKTGHIDGVDGLAGVVPTAGGVVSFALLANGDFSSSAGDNLIDSIVAAVSEYPSVPTAAALVPAPAA